MILSSLRFIATVLTLYVVLATVEVTDPSLGKAYVENCRSLARESMPHLAEVSRDNLNPENPSDVPRLQEIEARALEIESELQSLKCDENQDQWAYGSFKQEMRV